MKKILSALVTGIVILGFAFGAFAADRGSKEEAQALVKKIIQFHKANGKDKAMAEGNKPGGPFRVKDLSITAFFPDGVNIINANPKMPGKNLMELKDVDGVFVVKGIIKIGTRDGSGWFDYRWPNATSKKVESMGAYVEKFEDVIYYCAYTK